MDQDARLLAGSESMSRADLTMVAAELGRSQGSTGVPALRNFLTARGPGSQDLRCASICALAVRLGAASGHDLLGELVEGPSAVREYAADAIYHFADNLIWGEVLAWYGDWLGKPISRRKPIPPAMPLSYLLINAPNKEQQQLVTFVRTQWGRLLPFEQQWLTRHAPEIVLGGPPPHDVRLPRREDLPFQPEHYLM